MARTKVLLLKHIKTLGGEGDQVDVKKGHARNYLLPMKIAIPMTQANEKRIAALQKEQEAREQKEVEEAKKLMNALSKATIAIVVKTGENGKMFGAVGAKEICDHLAKDGIEIEKKAISLKHPIKEIGCYAVTIRLHETVQFEIKVDVVSENPVKRVAETTTAKSKSEKIGN